MDSTEAATSAAVTVAFAGSTVLLSDLCTLSVGLALVTSTTASEWAAPAALPADKTGGLTDDVGATGAHAEAARG